MRGQKPDVVSLTLTADEKLASANAMRKDIIQTIRSTKKYILS